MFKFTPKNALNEGEEFSLLNPFADRQIKNGPSDPTNCTFVI